MADYLHGLISHVHQLGVLHCLPATPVLSLAPNFCHWLQIHPMMCDGTISGHTQIAPIFWAGSSCSSVRGIEGVQWTEEGRRHLYNHL